MAKPIDLTDLEIRMLRWLADLGIQRFRKIAVGSRDYDMLVALEPTIRQHRVGLSLDLNDYALALLTLAVEQSEADQAEIINSERMVEERGAVASLIRKLKEARSEM